MNCAKAFVASLILSIGVCSGKVRSIVMDGGRMFPITLKMGRSTVLSFSEKPRKVVIGNQNYYFLQYIEGTHHVTLQPQGRIPTNLFIYGKNKVYGFLLQVTEGNKYDDLIKVTWRKRPGRALRISRDCRISLKGLDIYRNKVFPYRGLFVVDAFIVNTTQEGIDLKELVVKSSGGGIGGIKFFIEKEGIPPFQSSRMRIFLILKGRGKREIHFIWKKKRKSLVLAKEGFKF